MGFTVRRHILIDVPPGRAYRHLATRLGRESAGELRVGSRWRSSGATAGARGGDECEVTMLEPDRAIGLRIASPTSVGHAVFQLRFLLDPSDGRTRLTFEGELRHEESTGPLRALGRLGPLQGLLLGLAERLVAGTIERGLSDVRDELHRAADA